MDYSINNLFKELIVSFIPIFVSIDVLGMVPVYLSLTDGMSLKSRRKLTTQATATAFIISMLFLWTGRLIFKFMGITEHDFRIGGGIVLLVLAVTDLLFSQEEKSRSPDSKQDATIGVVPLGIPLIMGPAALTTILISVEAHGYFSTTLSLSANLFIVWIVFRHAHKILKVIGPSGAKAFAKVSSLFIAAIAVMMIRVGVTAILGK